MRTQGPGRHRLLQGVQIISLSAGALFSLFPIVWIMMTSVKLPRDYFSDTFIWVPDEITLDHYGRLFSELGGLSAIGNSLVVAVATTILTLGIGVPAAYAIANAQRGPLQSAPVIVLALRAIPPVILLVPLFLVFVEVGLLDTYIGLILAFSTFNIPFTIWMMKGFFEDFPKEVQEAARVDGLSEFKSFLLIVLPMVRPGLVVVAFFAFLASWNELMMSVTFTGQERGTVTKLIASLLQSPTGTEFGAAAAISFISMVPGIILVIFGQRYLVKGLTGGSVK
jgi:multiple sugar transport system permease protein